MAQYKHKYVNLMTWTIRVDFMQQTARVIIKGVVAAAIRCAVADASEEDEWYIYE